MNVYDFDQTILWKDSTFLFVRYCLTRYPATWKTIPGIIRASVQYLAGKINLEQFKEKVFVFLAYIPATDKVVEQFWETHSKGIKGWYLAQKRPDDVVVSASPEFLLKPICKKLGVEVIGTIMDSVTGKITGLNCKGEEKVPRFRALHPDAKVENFYSDSLSDTPLARLAEHSYIIKGEKLSPWPQKALQAKSIK